MDEARERQPRPATGSDSRERILRAAAQLFRERGYHRTTVRDIAEQVGILSGSLFHHFRSKDEMLREIMREAALSVCVRADEVVAREPTAERRLRGLIAMELDCVVGEASRDYRAVLFMEWREVPESIRPELTALRRRYGGIWRAVLDDCEGQGLLRCEAQAALHVLHGAVMGTMHWYRESGRYRIEEFGEILAKLVLADPPAAAPARAA